MVYVLLGAFLCLTLLLGYAALVAVGRYLDSPLSEMDLYLGSVDAAVDELEARRATRPLGSVVAGPWVQRDEEGA